ncbi:MAG: efflux RND transporter periplasmic adaptor subunit [candidate division Zixibacteria bacterium]|nr:efflux RND transporter periplasmic adaptor subunit [candidate division Zixibacteria bacterium]
MSKKKVFLFIGIGVVVVAVVVMNLTMNTSNAISVQSEIAKTRDIVETVSASGRIQPRTKVEITSEISGEIVSLKVGEGNFVNVGDLLIVLDTVQLQSDVDQAKYAMSEITARLNGYKASLDQTKKEYEIQKKLFAKDHTSETIYDNSKFAYLNSKSNYEASLAQQSQLQSRFEKQLDYLSKAKIVAPMSGIITFLDCEVGEIAAAQSAFSQGKTLMIISDLSVFEVEVEVDETEINKIALNQKTDIEVDAFPDTTFPGEVVEIGNTALLSGMGTSDQTTNFRVKVVFSDPNVKIRPGMSATVEITSDERSNVLSVPYSAIVMRNYDLDSLERVRTNEESGTSLAVDEVQASDEDTSGKIGNDSDEKDNKDIKGVFVFRDGKARFIQIETGIADRKNIEISSGLEKGDSVITGPYRVLRTVKDGDDIQAEKKKAENK